MSDETSGLKAKRLAALKAKPAPVPYSPPAANPTGRRYNLKEPCAIDLSGWEPGLQIAEMNPRPVFVYLRASLDYWYSDPTWPYYRDQCAMLNIPCAPYHFFKPGNETKQINLFLKVTQGFNFSVTQPPILDAEYTPARWPFGVRGQALSNSYLTWLDGIERATGIMPWIYTNQNFWWYTAFDPSGKRNANNFQTPSWTFRHPCIVAWYADFPDRFSALPRSVTPSGFTDIRAWQYAEDGRTNGYEANDLNLMLK